jgi:DNA-binding beta-propeller fold protein YncE
VKPTERTAKPTRTPKTGLLALLAGLLHAQGSGAPSARRALVALSVLATAFAALAVCSAPALAVRPHVFAKTFGEPCGLAETPCGPGKFKEPTMIAVNEATGDVYVVDEGDARVEWFTSTGQYKGQFKGSGEYEVEGKVEKGTVAGFGGKAGETESGPFVTPEGGILGQGPGVISIAVDNDAASPSFGDVYVADPVHAVIDKFSSRGAYINQIYKERRLINGLGVATNGDLYVETRDGAQVYSGEEENALLSGLRTDCAGEGGAYPGRGFAVNSAGDLFVRSATESKVCELGPEGYGGGTVGSLITENFDFLEQATSLGLATELKSNDVYVDNVTVLTRFGPQDTLIEQLPLAGGSGDGVAVNSKEEAIYVAQPASNSVEIWERAPTAAPTVESEEVSKVTADSTTLEGEVNPQSEAGEQASEYHFEYGPCGSTFASCASSSFPYTTPPGSLAPTFAADPLTSVNVQELQPGTIYHYRVVAGNAHGVTEGVRDQKGEEVEHTFTTQSVGALVLPDHREWEMVSPPDKHGALIVDPGAQGESVTEHAAAVGGAMTFSTDSPTESEPAGYAPQQVEVLAVRGSAGWSSRDLTLPHEFPTGVPVGNGSEYRLFSEDLSHAVVQPLGPFIPCRSVSGAWQPCLSAQASEQTAFRESEFSGSNPLQPCVQPSPQSLEEGASGCFQPLVTDKEGFADDTANPFLPFGEVSGGAYKCAPPRLKGFYCGPRFVGATPDLAHVVLKSKEAPLTSPPGGMLYEWSAGASPAHQLAPVDILPESEGGKPTLGELGSGGDVRNAISADGSRVFWEGEHGALYVRDIAKNEGRGETLRVDEGSGSFQGASSDGSRVFYTEAGVLFECHIVDGAGGRLECEGGRASELATGVLGTIPGVSVDGSWVYFVSTSTLARGAVEASPNLYARHGGHTQLVAVLSKKDASDWANGYQELVQLSARVSPDGRWLAFMSRRGLTGYNTRDAVTGVPDEEVYSYHAPEDLASGSGELACASCAPSGGRPVGVPGGMAAVVPGWEPLELGTARYQPRYLSDSGRLFFDAHDPLVSQASGGSWDVYEYEPEGVGACSSSVSSGSETYKLAHPFRAEPVKHGEEGLAGREAGGCVALVSGGSSDQESVFIDASEDGSDVFFMTKARLAGADTDSAFDVYDAHECSSVSPCLAAAASQPPACVTEASCRPSATPQPAIFGAPASATFVGAGNVTPPRASTPLTKSKRCKKGTVRRRGRCVKLKRKRGRKAAARAIHTHRSVRRGK